MNKENLGKVSEELILSSKENEHKNNIDNFDKEEYDKACKEFFQFFDSIDFILNIAAKNGSTDVSVYYTNLPKLFGEQPKYLEHFKKEYFSDKIRFTYTTVINLSFNDTYLFTFSWLN